MFCTQEEARAALAAELKTLKAGALQKRAAAAGMGEDALEAALDSDDQAGRLIEFILVRFNSILIRFNSTLIRH